MVIARKPHKQSISLSCYYYYREWCSDIHYRRRSEAVKERKTIRTKDAAKISSKFMSLLPPDSFAGITI